MPRRSDNEEELKKREAVGVIRASRFVRRYAHSRKPITIQTIREMHGRIFRDAWPEIAGRYREENVRITDSTHLPPHHSQVPEVMAQAADDLAVRLLRLCRAEGAIMAEEETDLAPVLDQIVSVAAWIHHLITHVHPFVEGNGRTARLAANLILERYGLVGISIRVEKENKNRYRQALAQIDNHQDYEPLKRIIYEGLIERYGGVDPKYYA